MLPAKQRRKDAIDLCV